MNQETKRLILASVLIFLVVVLQRPIFEALGYNATSSPVETAHDNVPKNETINTKNYLQDNNNLYNTNQSQPSQVLETLPDANKSFITDTPKEFSIETNKYKATISSLRGGTLTSSQLKDYTTNKELVNLKPFEGSQCNPCLKFQNDYLRGNWEYKGEQKSNGSTIMEFEYYSLENNNIAPSITKTIIFNHDSYTIDYHYNINNTFNGNIELVWEDGLEPTEDNIQSDVIDAVGASIKPINKGKETLRIGDSGEVATNPDNNLTISEPIDWAAVQTKYFITAMLPDKNNQPFKTQISGKSENGFKGEEFAQSYTIKLTYDNPKSIKASVYLGPLDDQLLSKENPSLNNAIYWGWGPMKPIAKVILWLLNTLHDFLGNYGICLIVFAILIQRITSPLTKKTYESSQKMQEIQPLIKKIQDKYKNDSKKMNQEMMNLYKEKGVNPLGGCLPLLLQMPLLFAIFSVFRHTIELRGMPFIGWISDLSQPDVLFYLPEGWWIPLYGGHVALLPVLMGISIFLTQRLSMATMDSSQKPMMYIMNGFFILIFNGFPSGLNLYYTVYNLLNYFQQKSIRSPK